MQTDHPTRRHALPTSRRSIALLALLLVAALALGACGRDAEPTPFPTPTTLPAVDQPAQSVAAAATPTPAAGESPLQPSSPLGAPDSPMPTPTPTMTPFPTPQVTVAEGKAAAFGRIIHSQTGEPIPNAVVRLPEFYCPDDVQPDEKMTRCFWALDDAFSPFAYSDEQGFFQMVDIVPHEYTLLVGDMMTVYSVPSQENGDVFLWDLKADEVVNLGVVQVRYPPQ